jgi:hypothetical protein
MTAVADKYISKSGRTAGYGQKEFTEDLICASEFLVWAEDQFIAGHTGKEAFRAMMRMLNMDPVPLRKIVKGEL